ncbi:MAG: hypothetical protein AAGA03_06965 [Planctomycetota bacterium]
MNQSNLLNTASARFLAGLVIAGMSIVLAVDARSAEQEANADAKPQSSVVTNDVDVESPDADATDAEATVEARPEKASPSPRRAKELSVAPLDHVDYPVDRPSWLRQEPDLDGDLHTWVVVTHPCESLEQSQAVVEELAKMAVVSYLAETSQQRWDADPGDEDWIDETWYDESLVVRRYDGTVLMGDSERFESAIELEFSSEFRDRVRKQWQQHEVGRRLGVLGVMLGTGFVALLAGSGVVGAIGRRVG